MVKSEFGRGVKDVGPVFERGGNSAVRVTARRRNNETLDIEQRVDA